MPVVNHLFHGILLLGLLLSWAGCEPSDEPSPSYRIATYNIEDVRTSDVRRDDHPRLRRAAARIQALAPDILLLNELTYDQPGAPGYQAGDPNGQNARRFVENFLSVAQADSLSGLSYQPVMLPVNTGQPSGHDLNNDGRVVTEVPPVPPSSEDGSVAEQTAEGRAYGGDAWGFGTFPGQYGMALFVRDDLTVLRDSIRAFRLFKWFEMPDAAIPRDSTNGEPWYSPEEWRSFRLSSKSHWDVPVRLPDGTVLHVLASHPTPPAFDGPARRNERRNHDEIRLWVDYLSDRAYIHDDSSKAGGLHSGASFVVMGDLNADPDDERPFRQAIRNLVSHDRVHPGPAPTASPAGQAAFPSLDPGDTARWGKRVDYVLPSANLAVDTSGVWRPTPPDTSALPVSDHFPVWVDVRVGLLHVFLQHTSASLTINENAAPAVRGDMERHFDEMVPEDQPYYQHTVEGSDDMPAHIKASMLDTSLSIPVQDGQLAFGTWQGIYLNEHRNSGGARSLLLTLRGEEA